MPRFEVVCPASAPALAADVTLQIDAEHWLAALKLGQQRTGGAGPSSNILCDVQGDGSILVADPRGGGVFRIRELRQPPSADVPVHAAPVAPPRPAAPPAAAPPAAPAPPASTAVLAAVARTAVLAAAPAAAPAPAGVEDDRRGAPPAPAFAPVATSAEVPTTARASAPVPDSAAGRDAALARLLDLAMARVDAESGSVLLTRDGGRALEFVVVRGPKANQLRALFALRGPMPVGEGIVGHCVREGVAVAVSDAREDPRFLWDVSLAIGYQTRSILCVPIARGEKVLGAIEVLNGRGGAFVARDLAAVELLAREAAALLGPG